MYHLAIFLAISEPAKAFASELSMTEVVYGEDYLVSSRVVEKFKIPLSIDYKFGGIDWSSPMVGDFLRCKVLNLGVNGPFAFVVPDVAFEVALKESEGKAVFGPAKDFQMELEGCKQISAKQWADLISRYVEDPETIDAAVERLVSLPL